jgi:hypothetical protein
LAGFFNLSSGVYMAIRLLRRNDKLFSGVSFDGKLGDANG